MPFPAEAPTTIPLSWKQKQRVCVNAGLRCMNAPMVLLSLCSMVFSLPHLKWDEPIDHLELFAGVCSISRGEWEDFGGKPEAVDFNDFADRTLKPPNKKKLVVKYKDSKGKNRIKGSGALKASEAYPRMLGKGVARVTTRYRMRHHREARQFLRAALRDDRAAAESSSRVNKFWVDQANLTPVLAYLGQQ
ncbi:unnamed protein product [Durusdinium trenchii]|uniref:Uncharacterized protein n=2 Tax=Durusdinium trenchii TaxID=1381693 RepID=A0ABP0IIV2_9DINO